MPLAETRIREVEEEKLLQRELLITKYLPYVKRIVNRMAIHIPPSVDIEDLVSAGIIGLLEAVERYDSDRDNKFITYAIFRIRGAVLSELRSRDFLSRSSRKKSRELSNARVRLEQTLGRGPADEEIAEELGMDLDAFYELKNLSCISFISLKDIGYGSGEEKKSLLEFMENDECYDITTLINLKEMENAVAKAIEQLAEKEKLVISLYYWDELTMKEIGAVLEITESRVSQLHSQALIKIRTRLKKEGMIDD